MVAVSQSGETADTLAVLRKFKESNLDKDESKTRLTLGIVNTIGSTIARKKEAGVYNHAGPEIGVASTKAFTSQLVVLALFLGRQRNLFESKGKRIVEELS